MKKMIINLEKLQNELPQLVLDQIDDVMLKYDITDTVVLAHFLAQCDHESGGWKFTSENLNYSVDGLLKIFHKYFSSSLAKVYARQPEKIANRTYSNRMGNGSETSGEGWKYRGRGYIQLTGKYNYSLFDREVTDNILENPDLVATKYPLMSAGFFFNNNRLWDICEGTSIEDVKRLTKRINGGLNGIDDRIENFNKYLTLLNAQI